MNAKALMAYTTTFTGSLEVEPSLHPWQVELVNAVAAKRHSSTEPCSFTGTRGALRPGYEFNPSHNRYMGSHECHWVADPDGSHLRTRRSELNFQCYVDWLAKLVVDYFAPWGTNLTGRIAFKGAWPCDYGNIVLKDNRITLSSRGDCILDDTSANEVKYQYVG